MARWLGQDRITGSWLSHEHFSRRWNLRGGGCRRCRGGCRSEHLRCGFRRATCRQKYHRQRQANQRCKERLTTHHMPLHPFSQSMQGAAAHTAVQSKCPPRPTCLAGSDDIFIDARASEFVDYVVIVPCSTNQRRSNPCYHLNQSLSSSFLSLWPAEPVTERPAEFRSKPRPRGSGVHYISLRFTTSPILHLVV